VQVAQDCPVTVSVVPTANKNTKPSIHVIQYNLLSAHPYRFTLEDLIYTSGRKIIPAAQVEQEGDRIAGLFQKSHPCMRASMLPKKFGWGVHYDSEGKLAIYGMETEQYRAFVENPGIKLVFAMRNKRASS
jgi:hypothetical protein